MSAILIVTLFFGNTVTITKAAESSKTTVVSPRKTDMIPLAPLEARDVQIEFKNTGSTVWGGASKMLVLRTGAKRESFLYHDSWQSKTTVKEVTSRVAPGQKVAVGFRVEAPAHEGEYTETFSLAVGNQQISESSFALSVTVKKKNQNSVATSPEKKTSKAPLNTPTIEIRKTGASLAAVKLIQSDETLAMPTLGRTVFRAGFKNSGTVSWTKGGSERIALRSGAKKESYFYDATTWVSGNIVSLLQEPAAPGEISYFNVIFEAPKNPGAYTEKLALYAGDTKLPGTDIVIPIDVFATKKLIEVASIDVPPPSPSVSVQPPSVTQTATSTTPLPETSSTPAFIPQGVIDDISLQEPSLRIGLFAAQDQVRITAQKDYDVRDTQGSLLSTQVAGAVTTISYDVPTRITTISNSQGSATSTLPVRFTASQTTLVRALLKAAATDTASSTTTSSPIATPLATPSLQQANDDIVFEIVSYTNRPGWSTTLNDNKFRSIIEIRYAESTSKLWVINELRLEQYLKGIAETSNNSPYEYQKALIIAARTYALYHINRSTKYAAERFTVRATDSDQVYRGYNAEIRLPNVARAVDETRGAIVTYNGTLAITPYYSQSDGRTRSWQEVWAGGPYPWLVGKSDPCCTKLPMLGHGVGMSARGALIMALDGKIYEEILKYYYTGIELRRRYL